MGNDSPHGDNLKRHKHAKDENDLPDLHADIEAQRAEGGDALKDSFCHRCLLPPRRYDIIHSAMSEDIS